MAFRPHVPGTWHILGPKNHRPPLPFWPCPWVSPFPSPTKNRAFTHRHWDHPVNRRKRFSHSAVARGEKFRAVPTPSSAASTPYISNVYQRLSTFGGWFQPGKSLQNDRGLGFGLGIFLFFLLWHLAIHFWAPRLWKAPSIARNQTSMEGGTKSSNLGTGNWSMVRGKRIGIWSIMIHRLP